MPLFEAESPRQWGRPLPGQRSEVELESCLLLRTLWHGLSSGPHGAPCETQERVACQQHHSALVAPRRSMPSES